MINLPLIFFFIIAAFVFGIALIVAFSRNLLRSAFALFFVLFGMAGFYVLLGADFIAIVQILVYAGGVSVLLIFGTMLTADVSSPKTSNLSFQRIFSALAGALLFLLLLWVFSNTNWSIKPAAELTPTTRSIGKALLQDYILPFEVISFLLLAAMIGAIVLIKKGETE